MVKIKTPVKPNDLRRLHRIVETTRYNHKSYICNSPPNSFDADSQIVTFPPSKIPFAPAFPITMAGLPTWWLISRLSSSLHGKFHNQILYVLSRKLSSTATLYGRS